jgi:hypothetical protein
LGLLEYENMIFRVKFLSFFFAKNTVGAK